MNPKLPRQVVAIVSQPAYYCGRLYAALPTTRSLLRAETTRRFSGTPRTLQDTSSVGDSSSPRWKETPPAMKAPVKLRYVPGKAEFPINSDPIVLDRFYVRMLGPGWDKMISEDVKWQAVTHKSFDQGRRGFNDRLAFLGRQIVQLQASLALIESAPTRELQLPKDPFGRESFKHSSLEGIEILVRGEQATRTHKKRMASLAQKYGLSEVLRWLPKKPMELPQSGIDVVLTQAMYAIVGAVAMEKGGLIANEIARNRILKQLGFNVGGS